MNINNDVIYYIIGSSNKGIVESVYSIDIEKSLSNISDSSNNDISLSSKTTTTTAAGNNNNNSSDIDVNYKSISNFNNNITDNGSFGGIRDIGCGSRHIVIVSNDNKLYIHDNDNDDNVDSKHILHDNNDNNKQAYYRLIEINCDFLDDNEEIISNIQKNNEKLSENIGDKRKLSLLETSSNEIEKKMNKNENNQIQSIPKMIQSSRSQIIQVECGVS